MLTFNSFIVVFVVLRRKPINPLTMKMIIIFAALFAAALAAKLDAPVGAEVAQILRFVNDNVENAFKYEYVLLCL